MYSKVFGVITVELLWCWESLSAAENCVVKPPVNGLSLCHVTVYKHHSENLIAMFLHHFHLFVGCHLLLLLPGFDGHSSAGLGAHSVHHLYIAEKEEPIFQVLVWEWAYVNEGMFWDRDRHDQT